MDLSSYLGEDTENLSSFSAMSRHHGMKLWSREESSVSGDALHHLSGRVHLRAVTNVMDSDRQRTERDTPPQHWRSCKLIIDPALTNGLYKVFRYDGLFFNINVEDLGLFPVETVRDPRVSRLWSRSRETELSVPKFKVDEWYVGPVPPKEVTFSRLNDNVKEAFLTNMCNKYGSIEEVEIFYNPKNNKHLGIAKVVFDTVQAARDAAQHLHQTSVMGNIIHVEVDPKGENRTRYLQLLLRGLYNPWMLPGGSSEQTLQDLIDGLLSSAATQRQGSVSSPTSTATPLSMDTAYSSIWQDTPCSFGLTPRSQGTPLTPCLSATPLSQDSCYSSLQATPVLQGEPSSSFSVHRPLRRELCRLKPGRYRRRSSNVFKVNLDLKHCQPQPPHALSSQLQTRSQQLELWGHNAQSSTHNNTQPSFNLTSPRQEPRVGITSTSRTLPPTCHSFSILNIHFPAVEQTAASPSSDDHAVITELPPSAGKGSSSNPRPQVESLDSRIENLLINSQSTAPSYFARQTSEADVHSQDSPESPCSAHRSPFSDDSGDRLPDSQASLSENENDETTQAVSFLTRNAQSPAASEFTDLKRRAHVNNDKDAKSFQSLSCPKEHHVVNAEHSVNRPSGALTPREDSLPQPPPAITAGCRRPPPFPFPVPPFPPPRLPNGTIPIPPPGWIPPPGHVGICIPPPLIRPPPSIPPRTTTFLGPPPPLMAPPSVPPPVHMHPLSMPPTSRLDGRNPPRHGFLQPPWPAPPFPKFNPFVPPPDYLLVREDPHKLTVEKVLEVLMDELKSIIKKDITRKMIEGVSFKAFEEWWDSQEKKTKVQVSPLKNGPESVDDTNKQINPLSHLSGKGKKPPLPSFKVKRKRDGDLATPKETDTLLSSAHEISDLKQGDETMKAASEKPKRRHARPHELDSDDDEGKEAEEMMPDKMEAIVPEDSASQNLCDREHDNDEGSNPNEEEFEVPQHPSEDELAVISLSDGLQSLDGELFSDSSYSGESEYESSDFYSSDSFSPDSFEDSSSSNLSPEDEEAMEEEEEDDRSYGCIVLSSDEESMELDPSLSSAAPLTPGAQLDLYLQDWSDPFQMGDGEENQCTDCQQDTQDFDALMELQTRASHNLQPPSPLGLPATEPYLDSDMESPGWSLESLETIENLRPLTPSGFLVESDPDNLIKSKPTSPAVEEVERPQTPGKRTVAELESEESNEASEFLFSCPVSSELILAPPDLRAASYHLYQEIPKTPGREERSGCTQYSSGRTPATPGRDTHVSEGSTVICSPLKGSPLIPALANNPYIIAPKTPGRDIVLPRRAVVHRRKSQLVATSLPQLGDNYLGGSPITVISPCSLSESSSDGRGAWTSSRVRTKPLQGLENMLGLMGEENSVFRRKQLQRLRRRWRTHHRQRSLKKLAGPLSYHSRPHRGRSLCEEWRILHSIWKEGLDQEDARLLQSTFERLQEQDNGFGWLSDTLWIPHPLTKVPTEQREEQKPWPKHRTGSARSEGFYKISRKDKLKYLETTKLEVELPSTSTQGTSIPAQSSLSLLRAGSGFRSEQRRLMSYFSVDSDLLKLNQLKFRKKRIRFSRSHIHEWGLFAMEPIAADEMVIEYVGQIIRQVTADMREQRYEEQGIGSSYLFRVDEDTIIDATKYGNLARFLNHSCNPNCYAKIITVESQKKIVIYSRQPISINEELTYDYKFPIEETKIPCLCGAENCRGSLN
ncbi:histone-lysine N-methyltransferase SETD1B-A [Pleuronectes platessa]|uniref:histone-lysine N-methyltransferase SETD1B-A n=1 Tax=Pleuronectes platessa TaxID=8262 RepID=UPI00232A60B2|nr:histone-lysine N-methyltransferase SETD1B-A [Pleuronectes platessa]